jgi:hypothetical protein
MLRNPGIRENATDIPCQSPTLFTGFDTNNKFQGYNIAPLHKGSPRSAGKEPPGDALLTYWGEPYGWVQCDTHSNIFMVLNAFVNSI